MWYKCIYVCIFFKLLKFKFEIELLKVWNSLYKLIFILEGNFFLINNYMKVLIVI